MLLQKAICAVLLQLHISCASASQIAGLGSSYANGPGIPKNGNYAHILAQKLSANLTDLSVSGSTLLGMISSQIPKIPSTTNIVTITSGGNDLGFVGGLGADSAGMAFSPPSVTEDQLLGRWNDALAKIHAKAPNAKVYIIEYLTILGPDAKPRSADVPFNATRVAFERGVAATLKSGTDRAALGKETWVTIVPAADASIANGVGSQAPWANGNVVGSQGGAKWHPNALGHKNIADMLFKLIQG
jgi:lysophospholipase L1-like esterase